MRKSAIRDVLLAAGLSVLLLIGCNGGGGDDAPGNHTEDLGGTLHLAGFRNPLLSCVACHGAGLRGGEGPSCYSCHDNADHTVVRDGRRHLSGTSSSCVRCHGPGNRGGLGPPCHQCHNTLFP